MLAARFFPMRQNPLAKKARSTKEPLLGTTTAAATAIAMELLGGRDRENIPWHFAKRKAGKTGISR